MRKEVVELLEASRNLRVRIVDDDKHPTGIVLGGNKADFPSKLKVLALAIEAVDKAGSKAFEGMQEASPSMDPVRLRMALDGIFRWMRSMGIALDEPHDIVAVALGMSKAKNKVRRNAVPKYRNPGFKNSVSKVSMSSGNINNDTLDDLRDQMKRRMGQ